MSAATERPHRPARGEGRDALVRAAIGILSEEGVRGVTYRSVAERAGVTHGLVRHHFRTLAELLRTAVREWAKDSMALTDLEPGTGAIRDIAGELPRNLREQEAEHVAMYELAMGAVRTEGLREEMQDIYRGYGESVSRELRRAGLDDEDGALGRLVFAAIDGLVIQQLVLDEPGILEDGLARLHALLELRRDATRADAP